MKNKLFIGIVLLLIMPSSILFLKIKSDKIPEENFKATGANWNSAKKVEDYFIERMRMKPEEAKEQAKNGVEFRVFKESTLQGIVNNLYSYGIVRDEKALLYSLENTKDTTYGNEGAIKIGTNGTIDIESTYELATDMTAWEVANTLLNKPIHWETSTRYDYLFMPGNPHAPRGERPSN
ncbi:MAG: endolytic transglycosylase MltG [Patescibacteria group bacterium]|nr:endolytic transglycosylase MltG [Patescibacteria group bacterium]